jgi:hypothetical protein
MVDIGPCEKLAKALEYVRPPSALCRSSRCSESSALSYVICNSPSLQLLMLACLREYDRRWLERFFFAYVNALKINEVAYKTGASSPCAAAVMYLVKKGVLETPKVWRG